MPTGETPAPDPGTLASDLLRLQELLNSGRPFALALGWNDEGNEELRLYDAETDNLLARVGASGGYVAVSLIGPERSEGPSVAPRRSLQIARGGRSCGHAEDTSCKPAVFASERLPL